MYSEDNSEEFLNDEFEQNEENDSVEISMWASEVVDYSDSYGNSISYSAVNICGRPSKYPAYGDFAEAYSLRRYGPIGDHLKEFSLKDQHENVTFHDFIIIQYENFVLPRAIKIYETYHPGAVFRILVYCSTIRKWRILWNALPAPVEKKSREFCPRISQINLPTR